MGQACEIITEFQHLNVFDHLLYLTLVLNYITAAGMNAAVTIVIFRMLYKGRRHWGKAAFQKRMEE